MIKGNNVTHDTNTNHYYNQFNSTKYLFNVKLIHKYLQSTITKYSNVTLRNKSYRIKATEKQLLPKIHPTTALFSLLNFQKFLTKKTNSGMSARKSLKAKTFLYSNYSYQQHPSTHPPLNIFKALINKKQLTVTSINKNSPKYKQQQRTGINFKKITKTYLTKLTYLTKKFQKIPHMGNKKTNATFKKIKYVRLHFKKVLDLNLFFLKKRFIGFFTNKKLFKKRRLIVNSLKKGGLSNFIFNKNVYNYVDMGIDTNLKLTTTNRIKIKAPVTPFLSKNTKKYLIMNQYLNIALLTNPNLLKLTLNPNTYPSKNLLITKVIPYAITKSNTNLIPSKYFSKIFLKKVYTSLSHNKLTTNFIPIYYTTLIRFMEDISGNSILLQFYPFVNQSITTFFIIKYTL